MRTVLILLYRIYLSWLPYLKFRPDKWLFEIIRFMSDYRSYKSQQKNPNFLTSFSNWYLCLTDRTSNTTLDPVYCYQDSWAASKIVEYKPQSHINIGSAPKIIGILSLFVLITIDIRSIQLKMKGLDFNAYRAFTKEYIISLFDQYILEEDKYIYQNELVDVYDQSRGFGIGLCKFTKK